MSNPKKTKTVEMLVKMYNLGRAYERLDNLKNGCTEAIPPSNGAWKYHFNELGHIRDLLEVVVEDDE